MRCPVCEHWKMNSEVIKDEVLCQIRLKKVSFTCPICGYKNVRVIA